MADSSQFGGKNDSPFFHLRRGEIKYEVKAERKVRVRGEDRVARKRTLGLIETRGRQRIT